MSLDAVFAARRGALYRCALACAVMTTGCPPPPACGDGSIACDADDGSTADALEAAADDAVDADDASATGYVPYVSGEYTRVYVPPGDAAADAARYLNDHTLVRGPDGTWHLYGITNTGQGQPFAEQSLLHATAPALMGP